MYQNYTLHNMYQNDMLRNKTTAGINNFDIYYIEVAEVVKGIIRTWKRTWCCRIFNIEIDV